jgi:hypothetical protein
MDCTVTRDLLFRRVDDELTPSERDRLDSHLAKCESCTRELKLLMLPRRIARVIPGMEPSPYFYSKLRVRIDSERQPVTIWQILLGLSHRTIPTFAVITLALLTVFGYYQFQDIRAEVYTAYDRIFTSSDRPQRMFIADQNEITDESVLLAISEQEHRPAGPEKK